MLIDIEIEPSELSRDDLIACLQYAAKIGITSDMLKFNASEPAISVEHFQELVRDMYEYFAKQNKLAPEPVRAFFWNVCGKLV